MIKIGYEIDYYDYYYVSIKSTWYYWVHRVPSLLIYNIILCE